MTLMLKATPTASNALFRLTPAQQRAYERALATISGAGVTVLKGDVGTGKSLIIAHLRAHLGGPVYSLDRALSEIRTRGTGQIEETIVDLIGEACRRDRVVYFEDVTMFDELGREGTVDRPLYLHHVMSALYDKILSSGARLVIATADRLNRNNDTKGSIVEIDDLTADDYQTIIENHALALKPEFDIDKVRRTYKKLTGHQLVGALSLLQGQGVTQPDATALIGAIDAIKSRSNLVAEDVENVTLEGLVGIEPIARELMRTVIIPMTQHQLSRELGLKPARGVLLHGQPGTGKTTIGRALAAQMKGKFFLMDGSTPPGPKQDALLAAAEASSPSVFFIDDADVIFKNGENSGFARKLLTKLDGLESQSIGNVCIIMTAMDVADMPPAIVRSGRVDVWLHIELPDAKKRADILRYYARTLPPNVGVFDEDKLLAATEGFAPADLRGLVADARGHIAYDRSKGRRMRSFQDYLLIAAEDIWSRKMVLAGLAGKPQARPQIPKVLAPPPCTEGTCG